VFRIQVRGEERLIRMARAIEEGPDHLREHLGQSVRKAAQPTLRDVKKAAETNKIRGYPNARRSGRAYGGPDGEGGLRIRLAAAVRLDLDVGTLSPRAQFMINTAAVGAGRVPEYIEAGVIWRHPIMGNRKAWAASKGEPFFEKNVERNRPLFERRLSEATERVARAIDRSA
jgi:hypothetical protein